MATGTAEFLGLSDKAGSSSSGKSRRRKSERKTTEEVIHRRIGLWEAREDAYKRLEARALKNQASDFVLERYRRQREKIASEIDDLARNGLENPAISISTLPPVHTAHL